MSKFDVDSIKSMTMTDDGIQFELDESEDDEKEKDSDESEEEEEEFELGDEQEEEEVEDKSSRSKSKSDDIEARFTRLEGRIDTMLTAMVTAKSGGKTKDEEEEEDLEDLDDPKKLLSTIEKRVAKIIDTSLAPHRDAMQAATVRSQFDSAAAKYGETFVQAAPMVARLMLASKGTLTVDEAYTNLKENGLVNGAGRKTKQQIVKEKKAKTVDADDEEVVTSGNRVPLRKKGRSVKESAMEALKKLSRGDL